MVMTPRDPRCECSITNEMIWAGPVIQLCHHNSREDAEEAREKLLDILAVFTQGINPQDMFNKTIIELAEDYRKMAADKLDRFLTQEETTNININFMRNLSLTAQMIMCSMIIDREGNR